ncbi:MAG: sporulation protein YqfD [Acholeplasmatales bacterium]|nr:sporulation protein YqfD [Acholeplasmatales bacterium]
MNNTIKNKIQKQFKNLLWFNFSNINYDQLSYNLQREYSEYPYIDVYAKNNDIYVNIYCHDIDYPSNNIDKNGDIIATRDSIVDEYYIYSGTSNIYKNKFVKKGDVLISGKTLNNQLTGSQGLVLGYVYDKVYIEIKKEESILEEGEYQSYYQLSLFDNSFDINKNNNYLISDKNSNNIFNLFDFFSIKKIEEHEKNDIIKRYTRDEAVLEAQNRIINDFNNKRIYELEKITDIVEYNYNETDDLYCFTFIVKKIESIGEFSHY